MRLEIACHTTITITRSLLDLLYQTGIQLIGIESVGDRYLYLSLNEMSLEDVQQLLSQLRRIEGVGDARIVSALPSEIEQSEVQLLMDTISLPVALIDGAGIIIRTNQAFEYAVNDEPRQLLGYELAHFIKGFSLNRWLSRGADKEPVAIHLNGRIYQVKFSIIGDTNLLRSCAGVMLVFQPSICPSISEALLLLDIDFTMTGLVVAGGMTQHVMSQILNIAQDPYPLLLFGESGVGKRFYGQIFNVMAGFDPTKAIVVDCFQICSWDEQQLLSLTSTFKTIILDHVERLTSEQVQAITAVFIQSSQLVVFCSEQSPEQLSRLWTDKVFYRVIVGSIEILPLRFRKDEIIPMAESWLKAFFDSRQIIAPPFSRAVKRYLVDQDWPGNVAQLWHVLRATHSHAGNQRWHVKDIKYQNVGSTAGASIESLYGYDYHTAMGKFERLLISYYYPHYPSTRLLAKKLGLSHTAIANKLKEHKIR